MHGKLGLGSEIKVESGISESFLFLLKKEKFRKLGFLLYFES